MGRELAAPRGAESNESTSIGQTSIQIPQWMQEELRLSNASWFLAKAITSTPTWQWRLHSVHEMHLSLALIRSRPYQAARIWFHAASGHQ